jgi:hypothetical protein
VFAKVFNVPIGVDQACVFVEPGVIEQMAAMVDGCRLIARCSHQVHRLNA